MIVILPSHFAAYRCEKLSLRSVYSIPYTIFVSIYRNDGAAIPARHGFPGTLTAVSRVNRQKISNVSRIIKQRRAGTRGPSFLLPSFTPPSSSPCRDAVARLPGRKERDTILPFCEICYTAVSASARSGVPGIFRAPGGTTPTVKTICHKFSSRAESCRKTEGGGGEE